MGTSIGFALGGGWQDGTARPNEKYLAALELLGEPAAAVGLSAELPALAAAGSSVLRSLQGTRGAVLVEMGECEPGLELLTEGIRGTARWDEKAGFAPFLARGQRAHGNAKTADEFERLGRHLSALSGRE